MIFVLYLKKAMKKHNFSAGPSILPAPVMEKAANAVLELDGIGLSLIEISHRSKEFISIMDKAQALALELTGLSNKGYQALFLQGASTQFLMTAANLMKSNAVISIRVRGQTKPLKKQNVTVRSPRWLLQKTRTTTTSQKQMKFQQVWTICTLRLTTPFLVLSSITYPLTDAPLIADMSSDIFSRTFDYSAFRLVLCQEHRKIWVQRVPHLVIVKESLLAGARRMRMFPSMLSYAVHADKGSMFNTPPVFAVYTSMLTLEWLKDAGRQ